LLPSPNGSGANFINGLMSNPAAAITGTPDSILPYGLLDGGKPVGSKIHIPIQKKQLLQNDEGRYKY
jgi:hypothetical protein